MESQSAPQAHNGREARLQAGRFTVEPSRNLLLRDGNRQRLGSRIMALLVTLG